MPIIALGLSYHEASLELRERLALSGERLEQALDRVSHFVPQGVILSTCNRTEVYAAVGHRGSSQRSLTRFLAELGALQEEQLAEHLTCHWQEAAVRHLFRVGAGLESMILGEGQILGQVRQAYELAANRHQLRPELKRLFERALVAGKRARSETGIARSAVSVSQAAVELASRALGSLHDRTILVVGAGKMGELAARALRERGVGRVLVANRTSARADNLVERLGGESWPFATLDEALILADIVISSTAAEGFVITTEQLAALLPARGERPLAVVDIAMPRDVEPSVGALSGVHLFNLDSLQELRESNLDQRRQETARVEAIVEQEVEKYVHWFEAREVAPTIGALVRQAEAIRQDELARTLARLGPLSDRELNAINALTVAIMNKMLHAPITRLKERGSGLDGRHYSHAVRELFNLPPAEAAVDEQTQSR